MCICKALFEQKNLDAVGMTTPRLLFYTDLSLNISGIGGGGDWECDQKGHICELIYDPLPTNPGQIGHR